MKKILSFILIASMMAIGSVHAFAHTITHTAIFGYH